MALAAQILTPADLSGTDVDEMFVLMTRHYENVGRAQFETDLFEKNWIIRLATDDTGELCGFSTQRLIAVRAGGRTVTAMFSGDTIVGREHWGTTALPIAWGQLAFTIMEQHPEAELYWYLISKGYRTYRFLPLFFNEFYPRHDVDTPAALRDVIDAVARAKYPDRYDGTAGVIRAIGTSDRLRRDLEELTDGRRRDPHIAFFHQKNPGHANGDELCCVAPLTPSNFSSSAWKLIKSPRFGRPTGG